MENAWLYTTANSMQRTDAKEVIEEYVPRLPLGPGARVLDIGCGSGDVTAEVLLPNLPKGLERVIGIDVSDSMIEHARSSYGHLNLSFYQLSIEEESENLLEVLNELDSTENNNIETTKQKKDEAMIDIYINGSKLGVSDENISKIVSNVNEMSLTEKVELSKYSRNDFNEGTNENGFDVIFSFYCLHWVQNQRQALKNIYALLKSRGEAVLLFLAKSPIFTMYETLAKIPRWSQYMKDVSNFVSPYHNSQDPATELSNSLTSEGFSILKVECQERSHTYKEAIALKDAIKAVNPFYTRLPENEKELYLDDCLKLAHRLHLAEEVENGLVVTYKVLIAHIKK